MAYFEIPTFRVRSGKFAKKSTAYTPLSKSGASFFLVRIGFAREKSTILTGVSYYEFFNGVNAFFMYGNTIKNTILKKRIL